MRITEQNLASTYAASGTFTPVATPTDIITIAGALGKVVRVLSLKVATNNTAAGSQQFFVIKRSTLDTTGTFVPATMVPLDSGVPVAAATVGHYTANPGALGTAVGTINTLRVASPIVVPTSFAGIVQDAGFEMLPLAIAPITVQPVTLRGAAENLAINFNGAALVSGQIHAYTILWTEEAA